MRHRQTGMTMVGWLLVLAVGGIFILAGLRLVPIYLAHVKVVSTLEKVKDEYGGKNPTRQQLVTALAKHYNIEGMTVPDFNEITIKKQGESFLIRADYEHRAPFLYNIFFVVDFDSSVEVDR